MATLGHFPANFPNGPIVEPNSGRMAVGLNGTYFFLALFNRTGGGAGMPVTQRAAVNGLTIDNMDELPPGRTVADGLTIDMVNSSLR